MKAKDLYDKYHDTLVSDNEDTYTKAAFAIIDELSHEASDIIEARKVRKADGILSIFQQQNDKWNCIARLLAEKDGAIVLKENGFLEVWKGRMPEINRWEENRAFDREYINPTRARRHVCPARADSAISKPAAAKAPARPKDEQTSFQEAQDKVDARDTAEAKQALQEDGSGEHRGFLAVLRGLFARRSTKLAV